MKSPFHISYQDLIDSVEKHLSYLERNASRLVVEGRMTDTSARKAIEIERVKLKLFRKFKRNPQLDLFKEFGSK